MRRFLPLCCCLLAAMPLSARTGALERNIRVVADSVRATVFGDGDTLVVNNAHRYPTMSVCKFHQALALLDSLDRAGLPLTTRIPVLRSDLLSDTWSPLRDARPEGGYELTAAELLDYSVAQSDNNVCDLLFRFLGGPKTVNRYVARLGVGRTAIVADEETMHRRPDNQYLNWTTPLAAVRLLERFRRGELLSAEYGDFLLETMFGTTTGPDKLRGLLPADVAVAHKTGSAFRDAQGVMVADNDIGIVRLPDGRSYSIAVFVMDSRGSSTTTPSGDNEKPLFRRGFFRRLFQRFDHFREHLRNGVFLLRGEEVAVGFIGGVRCDGSRHGGFGQRMHGKLTACGDARESEHHSCGTVADHQLSLFAEGFQHLHQVLVPGFAGMLCEDRHGVAAGEYEGVVLVFMAFEVGDDIVGGQADARIGADFAAVGYREEGVGNFVFEKCFQILEQAHPVHGIHGHDGCSLCHSHNFLNETTVILSKFITFVNKYTINRVLKQVRT